MSDRANLMLMPRGFAVRLDGDLSFGVRSHWAKNDYTHIMCVAHDTLAIVAVMY